MDRNNFEESQKYLEQIKELFGEFSSARLYYTWADTFDIEIADDNDVLIIYHGEADIKVFKKDCKGTLVTCIYSVMGPDTKIRLLHKSKVKPPRTTSPKTKKNLKAANFFIIGMAFVCCALAVVLVLFSYVGNRNFKEAFYSASSIKVDSRVRVIQLTDLHKTSYGDSNKILIERVQALKPDIIICSGDIVDSAKTDVDYAAHLAGELAKIAPTYYIYGNNEAETVYDFALNQTELDKKFGFDDTNRDETALLALEDSFEKALEATGAKVLKNEMDTINVKNITVDVYGVLTSNPSSFWSYTAESFSKYLYENTDNLKITAVHEPYIFEEFQPDYWGDLMVCGHTHGGVMRVPILGPLYTEEGGLFPERNNKYVHGRYDVAGSPLIVSSGLCNSDILRINNQPELAVIDINKF